MPNKDKSQKNGPIFLRREMFVDATRAMSVVTGEKDNKQVDSKGFESFKSGRL